MTGMTTNALLLLMGVGVLYFGAEWLVRGATRLAGALGVSPMVIGLTVVSMGTSAPELVVCLVAALGGNSDLAMGNVMGSNLANIGLILGVTAMVRPLEVAGRVITREIPVMVAVTLLLFPLVWDGSLDRPDGLILLVVLALYLLFINRAAGEETDAVKGEFDVYDEKATPDAKTIAGSLALVLGGSIGLVLGGRAIVMSAEFIAASFGVPDLVIGLTLVAVGTSLPELATALVAAMRKEADIAVGNIIGSNVFNIAAILGITATVTPIRVVPNVVREELPAVLFLSLLAFPVTRSAHRVRRWEGAVLLAVYLALGAWLFRY
ncbi:calcium/sodium antiporter [Gaopeijia maritima]|uniref:Calcium/sodium antiporter n=1 Tax=Gaopeijia maritima TaxID=3119007 RepID=A0ABU9E4S0_9BACT